MTSKCRGRLEVPRPQGRASRQGKRIDISGFFCHLPKHAQEIYLEAYNSAWDEYDEPQERRGGATREETAHKVAWTAVKKKYEKDEKTGEWKPKKEG